MLRKKVKKDMMKIYIKKRTKYTEENNDKEKGVRNQKKYIFDEN